MRSMKPRTITVTGDADVRVAPDEAVFTLGVEAIDKDLAKAKRDSDATVARVIAAARGHGLDDKDIAADRVALEPRYEWANSRRTYLGFAVRKTIALTLRDLRRFESLLEAL